MWCSRCQQDVPAAFAFGAKGKATCARCGRGVGLAACSAPEESATKAAATSAGKSPLDLSDWKLEDDLREAQRLVRLVQMQCDDSPAIDASASHESPAYRNDQHEQFAPSRSAGGSLLGWLLFGCGLSGVVCGCALLAWSHLSGRGELWNIGLPVALVSQAVLACGLVLQYDGRARAAATAERVVQYAPPAPTHLHVNAGQGLHAAGLSVHFSTTPQQQVAPTSRQIKQQVDAALRRRAA